MLYAVGGQSELATIWNRMMRSIRQQNPFYHYLLAQTGEEASALMKSPPAYSSRHAAAFRNARFDAIYVPPA